MMSVETHGRASLRLDYLEYLNTHCQLFVCNDFPEIVTPNMKKLSVYFLFKFRLY